jgi:serine/threonine protein kinase
MIFRDRYWVLAKLGEGGMGITYRVWDSLQRHPAVIKVPKIGGSPDTARRFVQELHAMLALKHEHIVPITDYGDEGDLPFVVMRFLPGGSLAHYNRPGDPHRNPPSLLHCWLPGIAAALDFMHGHGVLHRDVKPANVFLDGTLKPFLGDFGIAKSADDSGRMLRGDDVTAQNVAIGTASYMAPEQFTRASSVTGRADQYALAITAYEMVAGVKPFRGEMADIVVEHATMPVPPLDTSAFAIPPSTWRAIERGLAKRPADRFATCSDFAREVLRELQPLRLDPKACRFLCPNCSTIIKLNRDRAGTEGRCLRCRAVLEVAADLSALWLQVEEQLPEGGGAAAASTDGFSLSSSGMNRAWREWVAERKPASLVRALWGTRFTTACLAATVGAVAAWGVNESLWRIGEARIRAEEARNAERAQATIDDLRHDLARSREDSRRLEAAVEAAKKSAAAP